MPIKIWNKSRRTFKGTSPDPSGAMVPSRGDPTKLVPKLIPWVLPPNTALEFHDEVLANKMRKAYPKEIIGMDDVKSQFDAAPQAPAPSKPLPPGYQPRPDMSPNVPQEKALDPDEQAAVDAALAAVRAVRAPKDKEPEKAGATLMDKVKSHLGKGAA